ncbi:hypothetical protein GTS_34650 [Gandjariella thermophila]|uniref:Transposase IS4-like domain-containing protein n=1 Tax=Gandjariella thermophila TaxID=1931992 RepID=A0A4D4J9B1_9PSEU|nr:hypothetical protein [Gandjariella thermophila]GDY31832.1 hypothetical protein GTS_34650 [Gandjariella thermophila]
MTRLRKLTPHTDHDPDRRPRRLDAEANDKILLRCSDPKPSAEDIALGYKQVLDVERGWRDLKSIIDMRPVYHRVEDRIRAHVLLCWLALLLIRIAETKTGRPGAEIRDELQRPHLGTFTGPAGSLRRRTELTAGQKKILAGARELESAVTDVMDLGEDSVVEIDLGLTSSPARVRSLGRPRRLPDAGRRIV